MENMDVDRELPVLQDSARVIKHMFPPTEASPTQCGYCHKVFSTSKKFTDHRRIYHGFYYISYLGLSIPSLLPCTIKLILFLEENHVLRKDKVPGPLRCHICNGLVPSSCEKVKVHYSAQHGIKVSVNIGYPDPAATGGDTTTALPPPGIDGLSSGDNHLAIAINTTAADFASEDDSIGEDLVEPDNEPAGSWDLDSVYSDFSDGVLENGPEDQVVPSSFTIPSSAIPPTDDQDEDLISPLDSQDSPSRLVYGSGGRCFGVSGLPEAHYLLI